MDNKNNQQEELNKNEEDGSPKSEDFDLEFMKYASDYEDEPIQENLEQDQNNDNNNQSNPQNNSDYSEGEDSIKCAYCGITRIQRLVKCNECHKWFCNGRLDINSASHILFHLTKSKHKEIYISEDSEVGEMVMQCYNCSCKNIFLLGYLEHINGENVIIICREPCLTMGKFENNEYDKSKWVPLIKDKMILDWIIPEPDTDIEKHMCQRINIRNMSKLEEKWEKEKILANQEKPKYLGNYLKSVKLSYNDGQDYLDIFEPLISAEEEYDRKLKETQKKINIPTKFVKKGRKVIAKFVYPRDDNEIKLIAGDELKITDIKNVTYYGFVIEIEIDEVHLELDKCDKLLSDGNYTVEFVWKGTSFKRMLDGLYNFVNMENSVSNYIYSKLLGHNVEDKKFNYPIPKDLSVKGLPELNYFQNLGVKKAIVTPFLLLQGPPGTGKTVTSAAIVYHLSKLNAGKILVCAPSNIAADQLSEKIEKIGLKVVRVCAKSREYISSRVEHLSLHNQIKKLQGKEYKRLQELIKKKEDGGELSKSEHDVYKKLKNKAETEILDNQDVIVTTCIASYDKRLNDYRFPIVLIDEATQACESECLLPLLKGAKHAILVGDHCQLGPVVLCKNAAKAGLKMSLFERLVKLKMKPHMLQVQYRMHPKLSEFPSNTFYYGSLQNGVSIEERTHFNNFPWPDPKNPSFFFHIVGQEELSASGTSYLNRAEAEFIENVVNKLLRSNVKADQIGIITPYEGQRCYLVSHLLKPGNNNYKEIEVVSVDSFQGREKDYIILSCVRSNENKIIGFLEDPRRLNVALTRARYGLIIVGNAQALAKHQLWINLLNHYKTMGLLVEGNLGSFKEHIINLPPPKRYIPEKMVFESQLNSSMTANSMNMSNLTEVEDIAYNVNETVTKSLDDLYNNANISRYSEFGYTNDFENINHFQKVNNALKAYPLKVNNQFVNDNFDSLIKDYNMTIFSNMNNQPNDFQNNNCFMVSNQNFSTKYGINYNRSLTNEKKFVQETEF